VLQSLQDFLHVLSFNGRICYVSDSCEAVVGHQRSQLLGQYINGFIHPDDIEVFTKEFGQAMLHGKPMRFTYRFRHASNGWIILESQCNVYQLEKPDSMLHHRELIVMARPYRNTSGALFDSFLEQKLVGERLMQQLEQLKHDERNEWDEREEQEEREEWEAEIHHLLPKRSIVDLSFDASVQTRQSADDQVVHQTEAMFSCSAPMQYLLDGNGASTVSV
jgi:PAS domain S-box-containing protein